MDLPVKDAERAPGLMESLRAERIVIRPASDRSRDRGQGGTARCGTGDSGRLSGEDRRASGLLWFGSSPTQRAVPRATPRDGCARPSPRTAARSTAVRLIARGVTPEVAQPLRVEDVDVSTERSRAAVALGVLPVFLLVSVFVMGMSVAVDSHRRRARARLARTVAAHRCAADGASVWESGQRSPC